MRRIATICFALLLIPLWGCRATESIIDTDNMDVDWEEDTSYVEEPSTEPETTKVYPPEPDLPKQNGAELMTNSSDGIYTPFEATREELEEVWNNYELYGLGEGIYPGFSLGLAKVSNEGVEKTIRCSPILRGG